ncbi:MAG: hypothetical protein ABIK83_16000 [Candidatus Zixiibacteriota bacterium]
MARIFEDGIVDRIAFGDLLLDLGVKIVGGVLCLPVASRHVEGVAECAIGTDSPAVDFVPQLGNQCPFADFRGVGEEILECGSDGGLMGYALPIKAFECFVIVSNRLIGWFDVWSLHSNSFA